MLAWGWRIPLLLGAPFGVVALYLRLRIEESPAYTRVRSNTDTPVDRGWQQFRRTVVEQWKPMVVCAASWWPHRSPDFMLTGYLPTYLKVVVHVVTRPGW